MSSSTAYAESVASCRAPAPLRSPSPAAAAATVQDALHLPVRRQLDFTCGGGNLDDDDEFLCCAAEEMERSLYGQTTPPPPRAVAPPTFPVKQCICGRGPCGVEWKKPTGWAYVCSAPACRHTVWCGEYGPNLTSQPAFWSHAELNNSHVFNTPSNQRAGATSQDNVHPQGVPATNPVNINLHGAGATAAFNVSPQGAVATTPVKFSPRVARSNCEPPTCMCTAGKCRIDKGYYVCHIPKGHGSCAHRELINVAAEESPLTGYNNPRESARLGYNPVKKEANGRDFVMMEDHNKTRPSNPHQPPVYDLVPREHSVPARPTSIPVATRVSAIMLHQPVAMAELEPPKGSPVPPKCTITPRSGGCYRCHDEGHWALNCPKKDACYHCGMVGHWVKDCPSLRDRIQS
ncbi:hypothetical protein BRADI_4g17221v3 [Brachypodium distachyon]|uniref:CCHC-type domain-containing protein n=1 Tax=Brachypodium distachyon TaxID=15368 RepID=A0A2K2CNF0_BRADI|nr:hypothetical protein BRADI_4g17221v3 [Brachypodium distachyon]